jgi:hypothetical protein
MKLVRRKPSGDIPKITNQWKKSRLRINNEVASNVLRNVGCYVRYPDIKATISLLDDGVHINNSKPTFFPLICYFWNISTWFSVVFVKKLKVTLVICSGPT